jgi:hypothetical protein
VIDHLLQRCGVTPEAISDIDLTEQGATIMPKVRNEPLEMAAPRSALEYDTSASEVSSSTLIVVS